MANDALHREITTVLLTGATGFVGSHVHPRLVANGFAVIGGTRDPASAAKTHRDRVFRRFDVSDQASMVEALSGVDAAIYLVHSMADGGAYADAERRGALAFREAAAKVGLKRIVYLGGMRPAGRLSPHLESRLRTGEILRAGTVPVIELQATMIVGGGSESFRIVRDLTARLPFMLMPAWLDSRSEPVAIADVAVAIAHSLEMPVGESAVYGLPGPEALSGRDIMLRTAALLGHHPRAIRVPLVTPRLSSYWIRLVTRTDPHVATELVEGLRSDILCLGPSLWSLMPTYARTPFDSAARAALEEEADGLPLATRRVERYIHRLAGRDDDPGRAL